MIALHGVQDTEKVQALVESLEQNGWQGAPLVLLEGEQLLTGVHRYEAAHRILEWQDSEIPMIDVSDVFAEDGLDFDVLYQEAMEHYGYDWYKAIRDILPQLSAGTLKKYGIDIN